MDFATFIPAGSEKALEDVEKFYKDMQESAVITEWKDHIFGAIFPAATVKFAYENWEPQDGDIIIATYVKTGTTWLREICRHLLYAKDEKMKKMCWGLPMPLVYIEMGPASVFEVMTKLPMPRRIFVTHLPANMLNLEKWLKKDIKILRIIRNPKDQAVSWYHFSHKFEYGHLGVFPELVPKEWDKWLDTFTAGNIPSNLKRGEFYPDHILSWLPYKNHPKVLFLSYEEMHQDTVFHVKRIAEFIGSDASEENVANAAAESTFAKVKKAIDEGTSPEFKVQQRMEFLRKGKVGEWKKYFTVAQSERMDEIFEKKLDGTGIKFIYE